MPVGTKLSLPSSLLEQIQESEGAVTSSSGKRRPQKSVSRKESRKQLRTERKHRKAEYFLSGKRSAPVDDDDPPKKKVKLSNTTPNAASSGTKVKSPAEPKATSRQKPQTVPSSSRTQQEKNEDAYIAHLEAKLGYSQGKKSKRYNDGLDDLFDFTNSLDQLYTDDNQEFEDHIVRENTEEEILERSDDEYEDQTMQNEEWHGIQNSDAASDGEPEPMDPAPEEPSTAPVTPYVPPHLRTKVNKDSEEQIKLSRQLKGLLNRMSEQNITSILDSVEEIYRNHRRHDVTSTISTLIIEGISSHSSLLDSYVVLHAAFISSLHKLVGIEFAAYFVQSVVLSYERYLSTLLAGDEVIAAEAEGEEEKIPLNDRGKEASNLMVLLSELYNFQVISCVLVFDIIRDLLNHDIQEFQVELLLKIVRNSGQQLRTDDPQALKDITQIIQSKLDSSGQEENLSSRTRFMLETLHNLKNNKVKHLGTQNQGGEAVERMKKVLSGLSKKRHVIAYEPLRVSLKDLHSAETKGKWWLVGAAWGGDPLADRHQDSTQNTVPLSKNNDPSASSALLKLSKKHGMNTDIRRSIFVVLMSSDDYVDACERLSQLKLTEVQQREIVRVVLHCCGNEKAYNPYYVLVCHHLCSLSHSYKITLQYCLWDFLRDLGETNVGGAEVIKNLQEGGGGDDFESKSTSSTRIRNMAKAYAWWIAKDSVSLAILKPLDFTMLKPHTQRFLRQLFIHLFLSSQSKSPLVNPNASSSRNRAPIEEIFIKANRLQTLSMGLLFFLSKGLSLDEVEVDTNVNELVKWGVEIATDVLRTRLDIVPDL